jgi:kynurenine formamidase
MAHDVVEAPLPPGPNNDVSSYLNRVVLSIGTAAASDRYQYSGSYHGTIHSHLDALCHFYSVYLNGRMFNGYPVSGAGGIDPVAGCPKDSIINLKDGVVTRGVLFDATLLPGKATPQGWLEPGTPVYEDELRRLEEIEGVRVSRGDAIFLYTGRWKRRAALGPWGTSQGVAGYYADVALFLKARGVSFIGHDEWNDVWPSRIEGFSSLPVHTLAIGVLGVDIFDNLDLEQLAATAKQLRRYDFMFTAAPLRIVTGMGSPLNPLAIF